MALNAPRRAVGAKLSGPAWPGSLCLAPLSALSLMFATAAACHSPATESSGQVAPSLETEAESQSTTPTHDLPSAAGGTDTSPTAAQVQVPALHRTPVAAPIALMRAGRTTAVFKTPGREGVKIANLRAMIPHHEVFAVEEFLDLPGCKSPGWAKLGPDAYACLYKSEPSDDKPRLLAEITRVDLLPFVYAKPRPMVVDGVAQAIPRWRSRAALSGGEPATDTFPSAGSFAFVRRHGLGPESIWVDDAGRAVKGEHLRAFKPSSFAGRRLADRPMPQAAKGLAWTYVRDVAVYAAPDDSLEPFATLPYHAELYWHGDVGLPQENLTRPSATPVQSPTMGANEATSASAESASGDGTDNADLEDDANSVPEAASPNTAAANPNAVKTGKKRGKKGEARERIEQWLEVETVSPDGESIRGFVAAKRVRRWAAPTPPPELPAGEVWIDVNLSQQVLTLGVGDKLLLATLVSSGKGGKYGTPTGLFRIRMKKAWGKMESLDGAEEQYYVEAVPYAQYFYRRFALHGSYWHDNFGRRTSHGCVNLSPSDSGFVYSMTTPRALGGWITAIEAPGDPGTLVRIHKNNAPITDRRAAVGGEDAEMLSDAEGDGALAEQ